MIMKLSCKGVPEKKIAGALIKRLVGSVGAASKIANSEIQNLVALGCQEYPNLVNPIGYLMCKWLKRYYPNLFLCSDHQ